MSHMVLIRNPGSNGQMVTPSGRVLLSGESATLDKNSPLIAAALRQGLLIETLITDWTTVTAFTHGWVNTGNGEPDARFRDEGACLRMQGAVYNGTVGQAAFQLPTWARPSWQVIRSTNSNGVEGQVRINPDGTVVPEAPSTNVWVGLDLTFPIHGLG